jgi:hypothetical protein
MSITGMLVQFSKVATGLGRFVLDQCHHASKRTAISTKQTFC